MRLEYESSFKVVYEACTVRVGLRHVLFPVSSVKVYIALRKSIYTCNKVKNRSFTRSVRTDEAEDLPFVYREAHISYCCQTSESFSNMI